MKLKVEKTVIENNSKPETEIINSENLDQDPYLSLKKEKDAIFEEKTQLLDKVNEKDQDLIKTVQEKQEILDTQKRLKKEIIELKLTGVNKKEEMFKIKNNSKLQQKLIETMKLKIEKTLMENNPKPETENLN